MSKKTRLSDYDHPTVSNLASRLTSGKDTPQEKVAQIFRYVRDEIKFGFTPKWDEVKASDVISYGLGYCNTKATLFVALCRAAEVPARIHYGLIDLRIMHGILPALAFPMLPKYGGHSWTEVELSGEWKPLDSYINDKPFYDQAVKRLQSSGRPLGYSVSYKDGKSSCEFNFGELGFVHMGAVHDDHGVWEDAADYFASDQYLRFNTLQAVGYPMLAVMANRNVAGIRQSAA
jgi:hypothetical protein